MAVDRTEGGPRSAAVRMAIALTTVLMVGVVVLPYVTAAADDVVCDANTGENGPTILDGTPRNDACLAGGNGPDIIKGKGGNDLLVGGRGPDKLRGGPGNDRLRGGQGPDIFICGPGYDIVFNNRSTGADVIDPSCEEVRGG
jgi:hypothetical protein